MVGRIRKLIQNGEKINVEFKSAQGGLPKSVYETVCSFLNTKGGEIILGVDDGRNIIGIAPDKIEAYKRDFANAINDPNKIFPTAYLEVEEYTIEGKRILYINIPEGSQVYKCDGKFYLRNHEGDYDITKNQNLVSNLFLRKSSTYSENRVFPYMTMEDLNEDVINKVRQMAVNRNKNHPWNTMDNLTLLKSASLYVKDYTTQKEGFTLACVLLFGKDITIRNVLPHYRTDVVLKKENEIRYIDRKTVETNLVDSYTIIMDFIEKNLPSPFYMEKDVRVDVRNAIFREIIVNTLMHREFSMHHYGRIIISEKRIIIENANKPHICGNLLPEDFRPYTKNPTIAKIFKEIGFAEELGSGIRNILKYSEFYFGSTPEFVDDTLFTTSIEITKTNFNRQNKQEIQIGNQDRDQGRDQDRDQGRDQVDIEFFCQTPKTLSEIMTRFGYTNRTKFRNKFLKPLLEQGKIALTNPNTPKSPKQKYITIKKNER
jgi:ATP-dependent DNA helicase RecG